MSDYPQWFKVWVDNLSTKDLQEIIWNRMDDDDKQELNLRYNEECEESHESPETLPQLKKDFKELLEELHTVKSETKSSETKNVYAEYVGNAEFTIPKDVKEYSILWEKLYYKDKDGNEVEVSPNYSVEDDVELTKRPRKTYEN
jgi:hypothetical protein